MTDTAELQLTAVVDIVVGALENSLVAVYQYGSALLGGLRRYSDIDVFALVDRPTSASQRRVLVNELMRVSGGRGTYLAGRSVELTIADHSELVPWRLLPRREFQYGEWLRDEYESGHVPQPVPDPELAPLVATVLTASQPLLGPAAVDVLDPVPHDDLVASMRQSVPSLLADLEDDTTNVLLTLARMAYTTRFGRIVSKDEAGSWALTELPDGLGSAVDLARGIYIGDREPTEIRADSTTLATAEVLAALVERD